MMMLKDGPRRASAGGGHAWPSMDISEVLAARLAGVAPEDRRLPVL